MEQKNGTSPATPALAPAAIVANQRPRPTGLSVFEPGNLSEAMSLCRYLANAGLVPDALRGKEADVFVVMATAHDLGLTVTEGFRAIHVIKGRPTLSAAYRIARAKAHPDVEYFRLVESTDAKATWEAKRRGDIEPTRITFTIEQAKAAKLTGKDNWQAFPAAMLRARAGSALADAVCPDAVYGLPATEEIEDIDQPIPRDVTPPPEPEKPTTRTRGKKTAAPAQAEPPPPEDADFYAAPPPAQEPAPAAPESEAPPASAVEDQVTTWVKAVEAAKNLDDMADVASGLAKESDAIKKHPRLKAAWLTKQSDLRK